VAVDGTGNVYVTDLGDCTLRKVTPDGVATTLAGTRGLCEAADGVGADAHFRIPRSVAVDAAGNIYVADDDTIRKVTPAGVTTTLAGTANTPGSADGTGAAARFNVPSGVAVDGAGNVYVADWRNNNIRKVTPDGTTMTIAGMTGVIGTVLGATPRFVGPRCLAIAGDSLIICDNDAILRLRHGAR
jgi:sugar lactone lactonase YvrE